MKKDATNLNEFLPAVYILSHSALTKKTKLEKEIYDLFKGDSFLKDRLFSTLDEDGIFFIKI
jgi:hypothetical protein